MATPRKPNTVIKREMKASMPKQPAEGGLKYRPPAPAPAKPKSSKGTRLAT